ncbi:MAG: hypothetical protein ABIK43_01005 [candidate division WOR-3 bacterium]
MGGASVESGTKIDSRYVLFVLRGVPGDWRFGHFITTTATGFRSGNNLGNLRALSYVIALKNVDFEHIVASS